MGIILGVLATVAGVLATLTMGVFLMACGANAKPVAIRQIKGMLLGLAVLGFGCVAGATWALMDDQATLAAMIGAAPIAVVTLLMIVLIRLEW